jgi:two-component system sensor histidine kinase YesM
MKKDYWKYLIYRNVAVMILMSVFTLGLLVLLAYMIVLTPPHNFLMIFLFLIYAFILYLYYIWVIIPYKETRKTMRLFAKGYILQGVFEMRYPISPMTEKMNQKFGEMLNTKELINVSKKQAEYLALQNQINPHFLYNTLEGIRSEALFAGIDGVAQMTEALSSFFRYTISNVEHLVTVQEELRNVENYYIIQQFRFEDRLSIDIKIDNEDENELLSAKIPKLTLQPIVENSIYHGLEQKLGPGIVRIKVEGTKDRLIITVSDNGLGISEDKVSKLNHKLRTVSIDDMQPEIAASGGIALVNVNSRIKLLFGDEYGLFIYSILNEGTDVEITIPYITE